MVLCGEVGKVGGGNGTDLFQLIDPNIRLEELRKIMKTGGLNGILIGNLQNTKQV
jgi:hypothetical protein